MLLLPGDRARTIVARAAMLTVACVATLAGTSSAAAPASAHPAAGHPGQCNAHRAHALKTSPRVLVWSKPSGTDPDSGGSLSTLYACLRPAGRSVAIGQRAADGAEYPGNVTTSDLHVAGTLVSDLTTTGLASQAACFKYEGASPACATAASQTARVFNLGTHRSLRQPLAGAAVAYAFTRMGAIAWEAPTSPGVVGSPLMLQAVGFDPSSLAEGPIQTLDTGALGASVHFTALTVQWTNAGQPQSVILTNAS